MIQVSKKMKYLSCSLHLSISELMWCASSVQSFLEKRENPWDNNINSWKEREKVFSALCSFLSSSIRAYVYWFRRVRYSIVMCKNKAVMTGNPQINVTVKRVHNVKWLPLLENNVKMLTSTNLEKNIVIFSCHISRWLCSLET